MKYVALLRSINVGKHNRVSMKALLESLDNQGITSSESYLQSGNILFDWAPARLADLEGIFGAAFADLGLSSLAVIRTAEQMAALVESDPFSKFEVGEVHQFVAFLHAPLMVELPSFSKKGDVEIAKQSALDVCFVSRPIAGVHSGLTLPKGILATSRNWNVTRSIARLLGRPD